MPCICMSRNDYSLPNRTCILGLEKFVNSLKFAKMSQDISCLMDEVLTHVFEYLPLDDIKSCRLVCSKWHRCCEDRSISNKEKFVFCGNMCTSNEINYILKNNERTNIHLELFCVQLKSVHFWEFGWKIRTLQITPSFYDLAEVKRILLLFTPNLTHFHCILRLDHMLIDQVPLFLENLFELKGGEFLNLETIVISGNMSERIFGFEPEKRFCNVVPRLKTLHLLPPFYGTHSLLSGDDMKEVSGLYVEQHYNVSLRISQNLFPRFPSKLKKLDVIMRSFWTHGPIDSSPAIDLFSQQSQLEELSLEFKCFNFECRGNSKVKCPSIRLLLDILTRCKRLKKLRYVVNCSLTFHMGPNESSEFLEAASTSDLRNLEIPMFTFDCTECSFSDHLMLFKRLESLILFVCPSMINYRTVNEELSKILYTQKNLRKFSVYVSAPVYDDDGGDDDDDEEDDDDDDDDEEDDDDNDDASIHNEGIFRATSVLRHIKLEHFEFKFYSWDAARIFLKWKFPRLKHLKLTWVDSINVKINIAINDCFLRWIKKMSTLTCLEISCCYLYTLDCVKICKRLTSLRSIHYETLMLHTHNEDVKYVFSRCPVLKEIIIDVVKTDEYHYRTRYRISRSDGAVYASKIIDEDFSYPYERI